MVSLPSPSTVLLRLSMLRAERDLASLRTLAEAGEHGFAEEAPLNADNEPLVSSLLDLHDNVVDFYFQYLLIFTKAKMLTWPALEPRPRRGLSRCDVSW